MLFDVCFEDVYLRLSLAAGEGGSVTCEQFKDALGVKISFFDERLFSLLDNGTGHADLQDVVRSLNILESGTAEEKLALLLEIFNVNGTGYLDVDELKHLLSSSVNSHSLQLTPGDVDDLVEHTFTSLCEDGSNRVSVQDFILEMCSLPEVLDKLTVGSSKFLRLESTVPRQRGLFKWCTAEYIGNNIQKIIFILTFYSINLFLFIYWGCQYMDRGWSIILARGSGMCLNLNSAIVLLPMLRGSLTLLRKWQFQKILPLNQNVLIHRIIGHTIAVFAVLHSLCHLVNVAFTADTRMSKTNATLQYWEYLFTLRSGVGYISGFAYPSGLLLIIIFMVMFTFALSCVRRSYHQAFYWTHTLYVFYWLFLILHAARFWYFFIGPGFILLLEKIFSSSWFKRARYGRIHIKNVELLAHEVLRLEIERPKKFKFQPGDYVFLNVPVIANYQWHPFTMSSAPEIKGSFTLHIRVFGDWTKKLFDYFSRKVKIQAEAEQVQVAEARQGAAYTNPGFCELEQGKLDGDLEVRPRDPELKLGKLDGDLEVRPRDPDHTHVRTQIFLAGPYGSPTREIFECEHVVLVCSGIGVTPFASILQSIMCRHYAMRRKCPECSHVWYDPVSTKNKMKLTKVDFIWINRNAQSNEWFVDLLRDLEQQQEEMNKNDRPEDASEFLSVQLYITGAQPMTSLQSLPLKLALEKVHENTRIDAVTKLGTRAQYGRPDWNKVFGELRTVNQGKVTVFYCGTKLLGKSLKTRCEDNGFDFRKEYF